VPWLDELDASKSYLVNPVDREDVQPVMFDPRDNSVRTVD
jgi:hypothetical protein